MQKKRKEFWVVLLSMLFLWHSDATAIVAGNDFFGLDFRFNNPGARANAMGGAFVGLADDATAAYANPAGLTILTEPEISAEFKYGAYTNRVPQESSTEDFTDTNQSVSFLSLAYPTDKATISVYRHHLVNIKSDFELQDDADNRNEVSLDLDVVTLGLGLGFKVTNTFSLGVSIGFAQLDYKSEVDIFDIGSSEPQPKETEVVNDSDNSEQYTVSLLWNPISALSIGATYRYGPEFDTDKQRWSYEQQGGGDYRWLLNWRLANKLKIPDVFGAGLGLRFIPNLTGAVDVYYVEYSDLLDNFRLDPGSDLDPDDFKIDDTFEIHCGLEYVMALGKVPFALRAGYLYRPDHSVRYVGPVDTQETQELKDRLAQRDVDEHIVSAGLGIVLFDTVQVDVAGSYGELITEGTLSLVYRF